MEKIIYAVMPAYGGAEKEVLLLVRSLRELAGETGRYPIWVMLPEPVRMLSKAIRRLLVDLGARLVVFPVDQRVLQFPFGGKVFASAAAETLAEGTTQQLVWLDPDTLFLRPCQDLYLPTDRFVGCRPVHHRLIGSAYNEPLNPFWSLIYDRCGVKSEQIFSMQTVVEHELIRPYVNAGLLVVRPEVGLLRKWRAQFARLYKNKDFEVFYERRSLYRIFMHQAVLAGVLMANLDPQSFHWFPEMVNFPLNLVHQIASEQLPVSLNTLISCRYDSLDYLIGANWETYIPVVEPLASWLLTNIT